VFENYGSFNPYDYSEDGDFSGYDDGDGSAVSDIGDLDILR